MQLNQLKDNEGARQSRTRVGRGIGSGKGKTCGRGMKGQKSRSGVAIKGFEGGQNPLYLRLPKRGFINSGRKEYATINTGDLQRFVDSGRLSEKDKITSALLAEKNILKPTKAGVKVLAKGELKAKLNISVEAFSVAAEKAVSKAGGSLVKVEAATAEAAKTPKKSAASKSGAKTEKKPAKKAASKAKD